MEFKLEQFFRFFLILALLLDVQQLSANELLSPQCRPLEIDEHISQEEVAYSYGLLWKVSKENQSDNYVFGTIHVSDPEVLTLPPEVSAVINEIDQLVIEAVPDPDQVLDLMGMMFFKEKQKTLSQFIDDKLYMETRNILSRYSISRESINRIKPWAAFLTMNYPVNEGMPLDLYLLSLAKQQGASVTGLETMQEQGQIFNELPLHDQVQLLVDTVCHYEEIEKNFEIMKSLYINRDLKGLYTFSNKYISYNDPVYKNLMYELITRRNKNMVERMQSALNKGNSLIAIGALHLPGKDGVLALLVDQGYKVERVY